MALEIPWSKATVTNGQKCAICYREGKIYSFGAIVAAKGFAQYKGGFWKEIRKEIVKHFEQEHPEWTVTRLREGPK